MMRDIVKSDFKPPLLEFQNPFEVLFVLAGSPSYLRGARSPYRPDSFRCPETDIAEK